MIDKTINKGTKGEQTITSSVNCYRILQKTLCFKLACKIFNQKQNRKLKFVKHKTQTGKKIVNSLDLKDGSCSFTGTRQDA